MIKLYKVSRTTRHADVRVDAAIVAASSLNVAKQIAGFGNDVLIEEIDITLPRYMEEPILTTKR